MSRFSSHQYQGAEDGRGQKRYSESAALPSSKRQTLSTEREDVEEKDLKRQSVIMPNADELEGYFASFNTFQSSPKIATDPRKLNNPDDLRRMAKKIDKFLKETDFRPIEFRHIRYLGSKDFKDIFIHSLGRVYPEYKFKKKFEDEMPKVLKTITYPSADQFNSRMFSSIAPHSFYLFLHLLEFMVDNAKRMMSHSNEETNQVSMFQKDQVFVSEDMPKLYRDFTLIGYRDHLRNEPIDNVVTDITEIFNILIKRKQLEDLDLTKESASIDETLKAFNEAQNKYVQLETTHNSLLSDTEKFIEYLNRKKTKIEKYSTVSQRINEQMRDLSIQSSAVVEKVKQLKEMVKAKGFSLEQVDSLQEQRTQLTEQYANLQVKSREINQEKKSTENKLSEADNKLKSAFIRLQAELKVADNNSQSDESLIELKNAFDIGDGAIVDHALNMSDNVWNLLSTWGSHSKTHYDNIIDHLHSLKTKIIDKREKYDELEKDTQELVQKMEEKKNEFRAKEKAAKAEYSENDRVVAEKEQMIHELKNTSNSNLQNQEQEMDTAYAEMARLEYMEKTRDSKFKDDALGLEDHFKLLALAAKRAADAQESLSIEYSKGAN